MLIVSSRVDPYQQSHPMPSERVEALDDAGRDQSYWEKKDTPELQLRHDMMRAKLVGFLERPDQVARRYPLSDTSLPARYARAISAHRFHGIAVAVRADRRADRRAAQQPYFYELKGQALLEGAVPPTRSRRCARPRRWRPTAR